MDPSRSKKTRSLETQLDIISDLPEDVLYRIMERLPLRDAARMSLLSHKWQHIWTSMPHLAFDVRFFMSLKDRGCETQRYCDIVNKILLQHEGPILRFLICVPPMNYSIPDVAPWISHLSRNGLREFSFSNVSQMNIKLSSRLFSCGGLEKLTLSCCLFSLPPKFEGFPKLTSLELDRVFLSHFIFKKLMANCLALKKLVLTNCYGMEQMHVIIDAPNLQILVLDGAFESLELKSCENLVSASIGMMLANICHKARFGRLLKVPASSSKLERLCLRGGFCRVFFKERSLHGTFERLRNLEFLHLQLDNQDDFSSLLSCMQSFSSIETLRIHLFAADGLRKSLPLSLTHLNEHSLRGIDLGYTHEFFCTFGLLQSCSSIKKLAISVPVAPRTNVNSQHKHAYGNSYKLGHLVEVKFVGITGSFAELKLIEYYVLDISTVLEKLFVIFGLLDDSSELKV